VFEIEQHIRLNLLIDIYGSLLTDKQKTIMDLYFEEDLSLAEIAETQTISRNAVHDHIKRTVKILENYEENLQLLSKYQKRMQLYQAIKEETNEAAVIAYINQLEELE
jgi:uncharacterized protein